MFKSLVEKYNIDLKNIGRLEVGTETIIDKSKATKTVLMDLFKDSGNFDVEGIDTKNACYGGTSALFNAVNWIESSSWDGRLAIVVCGDIAVYAPGNARSTGGAGTVAFLVGPNAPIVIERGIRGSHHENAWDFYKPDHTVEWPTVDGQLSNVCYLNALDKCFEIYCRRYKATTGRDFKLEDVDFFAFHSPYNKLVQRSFARLIYNDFCNDTSRPQYAAFTKFASLKKNETFNNVELDKALMEFSKPLYAAKVAPSTMLPKQLGNIYTGSLYSSLVSLISLKTEELTGKRVMLFSYGSGLTATMFSVRITRPLSPISQKIDLKNRLAQRIKSDPAAFTATLALRRDRVGQKDYVPAEHTHDMFPGTFYLDRIDDKHRRFYKRKVHTPPAKL